MKKFLLLFLLLSPFIISAQTETDIRIHYTEVNKQIEESIQQGYEGPLYQNQLVVNKNGKSWRAVGRFADTVSFWYSDVPGFSGATETDPKNVLLKVTLSRSASDFRLYEEYLYKNGRLVFYYSYAAGEGEINVSEARTYFNNKGVMFKNIVKADGKELSVKDFALEKYKDLKPNPAAIMAGSKKYQDLFIKSM